MPQRQTGLVVGPQPDRRHELTLSQTQLPESTGIPQAGISRFENGRGNPTGSTIQKLREIPETDMVFKARTH
ncbi:hypothetical protein GCM10022223_07630 [Kineosporia mesophila]|uniref:HTH cro/C1-type domain-containing protein n=1 Tax=Kineosporia mesophila TaxID=566012 RepID=A0ABP6Z2I5_9ACTN